MLAGVAIGVGVTVEMGVRGWVRRSDKVSPELVRRERTGQCP